MPFRATGSLRLPVVVSSGLLLLAPLVVSGCADSTVEALQQEVAQLRQDLNAATLALHRSRGDTETLIGQLDRRSREQGAETGRQLGALSSRVDGLAAELARVAGRLDEVGQRVDALSRARSAPGAGAAAPSGAPPVEPRASGGGPSPEQAYQAAYLDFTKGNFPLAVSGFREFVRRFPDSPLADQAQYWVGEAYFSMGRTSAGRGEADKARSELEQAVQEFRRVVLNYPKGGKVPGALYKEALALIELKQCKVAEARLRYLIDNFPQSEEAPLARERLSSLRG
jgi:tol-pal system protein YbgF